MNKLRRAYLRWKSGRGTQRAWRRGRNRNLIGHLRWFGYRGDMSRIGEILELAHLAEGKQTVVVTVTLDGDKGNGYVEINHKVEHRRAKPGWFKSFAFMTDNGAGLGVDLNRDDPAPRQGLLPLPSAENKGLTAINGGRE